MNENTPNPLRKFLEQSYGKKLTDAEVMEYKNRLVKFFALLAEIDQRNKRERRKNEQELPNKKTNAKTD